MTLFLEKKRRFAAPDFDRNQKQKMHVEHKGGAMLCDYGDDPCDYGCCGECLRKSGVELEMVDIVLMRRTLWARLHIGDNS